MAQLTKEQKIKDFDINAPAAAEANLFGLPFTEQESNIVILPVPWEVTVSYRGGTAKAPEAIKQASLQVDLFDADVNDAWKNGICLLPINKKWKQTSKQLRKKAERVIELLSNGTSEKNKEVKKLTKEVNEAGTKLKSWIKTEMLAQITNGKLPALLGGDHSTPLGFMEALAEKNPSFGILQIDAHCDLREAYEGFTYSHASIMYNALQIKQVSKLVQVGIRDFCQQEMDVAKKEGDRVKIFFDRDMKRSMFEGFSWKDICDAIINALPEKVYVSFDIDGLEASLCPNTGTPVAGGLQYEQAVYLLWKLATSGKTIIGFDLNEVAPGKDEWDANVGARLLYKLCNLMALSQTQKKNTKSTNEKKWEVEKEQAD
ncbi:agmatinase [Bacteroidota bacterium]|nr:agmatinase [Bacteroidota bacterium]